MSVRKLSTIRQISSIRKVTRNQSLLTIDGWNVVVKTPGGPTDFSVDEFVLFFEVDAWLPARGELGRLFSEVGNPCELDGEPGFRVTTTQLTTTTLPKEVIRSQGYAFRITARKLTVIHDEFMKVSAGFRLMTAENTKTLAELFRERDCSALLGVKKWEKESETKSANPKLPPFIIKTEMKRVQNCVNLFENKYKAVVFQESVKMDGASMTMYYINESSKFWEQLHPVPQKHAVRSILEGNARVGVCSKNFDLLDTEQNKHYWDTAVKSGILGILEEIGRPIAVQGELVGWNINGNPHEYPKGVVEFHLFSMINIEEGKRYSAREVEQFARMLGIKHVPVLGYATIRDIASCQRDLIDRAEKRQGEGLVFKNCSDGRWFKVHSASYILSREGNSAGAGAIATPSGMYQVEAAPDTISTGLTPKQVFEKVFPKKGRVANPVPRFAPLRPSASKNANGTEVQSSAVQSFTDFLDEQKPNTVPSRTPVASTSQTLHPSQETEPSGTGGSDPGEPVGPLGSRIKDLQTCLANSTMSPLVALTDATNKTSTVPDTSEPVDLSNLARKDRIKARMEALKAKRATPAPMDLTTTMSADLSNLPRQEHQVKIDQIKLKMASLSESQSDNQVSSSLHENQQKIDQIKAKLNALTTAASADQNASPRHENHAPATRKLPAFTDPVYHQKSLAMAARIQSMIAEDNTTECPQCEDDLGGETISFDNTDLAQKLNAVASPSNSLYKTAPEDSSTEFESLDGDDSQEINYSHPVLQGMPRDGTAVIFGTPRDPCGWKIKDEIRIADMEKWKQASINKTMRADDGGIGTWYEKWAIRYYGLDSSKRPSDVNDLYFMINPHQYRPEYRPEYHPNLFTDHRPAFDTEVPYQTELKTVGYSATNGANYGQSALVAQRPVDVNGSGWW
ncbi:hypothetical protein B0T16DRAFT_447582 [Cercophora newfieldiana]|uniref:RNA ligase domain-containing protein n=1 Tax=Cercophora newfieldiana TaxID=92897 RepID=A0AA39Y0F4_9PEZI|nr:hypothetical protein B0T16DRAFT_447582 [Cercophora newfieldiana]